MPISANETATCPARIRVLGRYAAYLDRIIKATLSIPEMAKSGTSHPWSGCRMRLSRHTGAIASVYNRMYRHNFRRKTGRPVIPAYKAWRLYPLFSDIRPAFECLFGEKTRGANPIFNPMDWLFFETDQQTTQPYPDSNRIISL